MSKNHFSEIKTEKQFLQLLRRYYRGWRRRFPDWPCSFLGLVEDGHRKDIAWLFDKYFYVGAGYYNWQYGNSVLKELVKKWDDELGTKPRYVRC